MGTNAMRTGSQIGSQVHEYGVEAWFVSHVKIKKPQEIYPCGCKNTLLKLMSAFGCNIFNVNTLFFKFTTYFPCKENQVGKTNYRNDV